MAYGFGEVPKAEGVDYSKKKNRVMFLKDEGLLKALGIWE